MNSVQKTEISARIALGLVIEAVRYAAAKDWDVAAAVVDPHGDLLAFHRSNTVLVPAIEFAIDKAFTASTMRMSTQDWFDIVNSSPSMKAGLANRPRLMVWTGGLPIIADGQCIGGIGVSGVHDHQDLECAKAALTSKGFSI